MRAIIFLIFCAVLTIAATFPNVKIGNNSPIDSKALLEVNSTAKGVLIPRMTSAERAAISTPTIGLLVYDTTLNRTCQAISTAGTWTCAASQVSQPLNPSAVVLTDSNGSMSTSILTPSRALIANDSGTLAVSTTTSVQLGYLNGLSSTLSNKRLVVTSSNQLVEFDSYGTNGQVLTASGAGLLPTWADASNITGQHYQGYFNTNGAADPSWSTSSSTWATPTLSGTNTLTAQVNNNFGTVTAATNSRPGINFTPAALTSLYYIQVKGTWSYDGGTCDHGRFRLWDGATALSTWDAISMCAATEAPTPFVLSGIYAASTASALDIWVQIASPNGTPMVIEACGGAACGTGRETRVLDFTLVRLK